MYADTGAKMTTCKGSPLSWSLRCSDGSVLLKIMVITCVTGDSLCCFVAHDLKEVCKPLAEPCGSLDRKGIVTRQTVLSVCHRAKDSMVGFLYA